jgi:ethanolaminephosphotransferase
MIGFLCNLIPHILILVWFGPSFEGPLPVWFLVTLAALYFTYMVADNSDGKQARRTGTSSPLGMLLDHGMDSVTTVVNNFIIQRVLQLGNCYVNMIGMLVSSVPFYFAVLEQYYTGEFLLQVVNGVDDGSFLYMAMCLLPALYGTDFWR